MLYIIHNTQRILGAFLPPRRRKILDSGKLLSRRRASFTCSEHTWRFIRVVISKVISMANYTYNPT